MDKISELQRAALVVEMRSIFEAASAERSLPSRSRNYDRPKTEVDDCGSRITTEQGLQSDQIALASRASQIDPRLAQGDASALSAVLARFLAGACRPGCDRDHVVMRGALEALAHRGLTPAEKRPTRDLDADVAAYSVSILPPAPLRHSEVGAETSSRPRAGSRRRRVLPEHRDRDACE